MGGGCGRLGRVASQLLFTPRNQAMLINTYVDTPGQCTANRVYHICYTVQYFPRLHTAQRSELEIGLIVEGANSSLVVGGEWGQQKNGPWNSCKDGPQTK